ncbi:MAG: NAD kinase [Hydrogenibacillus sp.]|nr:NAD kinase [Hydrogenibacillus sp.]
MGEQLESFQVEHFQLVVRPDEESRHLAERIRRALIEAGFTTSETPQLVIAVGGDGTMLEAFHRFYKRIPKAAFVGLHTGTLGFYADWKRHEVDWMIETIIKNRTPKIVEYPLVSAIFEHQDGRRLRHLALNEAIVKSKTLSTFVVDVWINGERFETFRGDGLIVSTPSGSTAYSHSVGGSIIHPSIQALQVSELAAINNVEYRTLGRSFVLPRHHVLDIYPMHADGEILVGIDGNVFYMKDVVRIQAHVAEEKVRFARFRHFPFWQRVRMKFLGD